MADTKLNIIITAKDEASANLDNILDAFEDLTDSVDNLTDAAEEAFEEMRNRSARDAADNISKINMAANVATAAISGLRLAFGALRAAV